MGEIDDTDQDDYITVINEYYQNFEKDIYKDEDKARQLIANAVVRDMNNHPTWGKAMKSDVKEEWMKAVRIEINALIKLNTGEEIELEEIPAGAQILPTKVDLIKKKKKIF
jgi:hypothetical protein